MNRFRCGVLAAGVVIAGAFALPIVAHGQSRSPKVRSLESFGNRASIGVTVRDVDSDDDKAKTGVLVEEVEPGSPADKAGIKSGDAITEFDGDRVRSVRQFTRLVQESASGRTVAAVLSRSGSRVTVNITPERSADGDFGMRLLDGFRTPTPPALVTPRPPEFDEFFWAAGPRRLGMTIESLDTQLAEYFGVKDGVLVKSVQNDSVAQKTGLKAGDVITSVNGRKVYEPSDVNRAIDRADSGDLTVEVMRDRKALTLKGKLETSETRRRSRGVRTDPTP
jgi:serine protease Do